MSRPPLILVRHGTAEGVEGRIIGQVDPPLSAAGAATLRRLADSWPRCLGDELSARPARIWASDLLRASQSAQVLAQSLSTEIKTDPRLREIDFGAWDGERWDEVKAQDRRAFDRFKDHWFEQPPQGGETFAQVEQRVHSWLDEVWMEGGTEAVVAVAHGGSIRAVLRRILEFPMQRIFHLRLDHGKLSMLESSWRGSELTLLNSDRLPDQNRS